MKILLHDYGGYPFSVQLGEIFAKKGHFVEYVYSETTQQLKRFNYRQIPNLAVNGIVIPRTFEKYNYFRRWRAEWVYGRKVADEINNFKPDVVISANAPLDSQRIIQITSRKVDAKFIFWFQDAISLATTRVLQGKFSFIGKVIGLLYQRLERSMLNNSQAVILISEDFMPLLDHWEVSPEKVQVIPNWAPVDDIIPQPHDNKWAQQKSLEKTFNFLFTGILGLKHDPTIFLHLAEHFQDEQDVRIVVISRGKKFEWLRDEKEKRGFQNLVLIEFQPADIYPKVLAAGNVLVSVLCPDAGEYSVPSKVLSYLCAGRSILLSVPTENLASKTVMEAGAGLGSPPDDLAGFLNKARRLYKNGDLRANFAKSARKYAEENFNIDKISQKFEEMIY